MAMKIYIAYIETVCFSDLHWYPFTSLHNIITQKTNQNMNTYIQMCMTNNTPFCCYQFNDG